MSIPAAGNRQAPSTEARLIGIQDRLDNLRDHRREGFFVDDADFAILKAEKARVAAELKALEKPKPTDIKV